MQAVVQSVAPPTVPVAPLPGQCWIVGPAPTGAWTGQAGAIAGWTSGGWRFVVPFPGMQAWSLADNALARRDASTWVIGLITAASFSVGGVQVVGNRQPRIAVAAGGTTVDVQARAAIAALIAGLETHGLFSAT